MKEQRGFRIGRGLVVILIALVMTSLCMGCGATGGDSGAPEETSTQVERTAAGTDELSEVPDKNGTYDQAEDVALYLYCYGELPHNYITKKQAKYLGWDGGSLEPYAPGTCIGGDHFGNYEGNLPEGKYTECDIDTLGKNSRGPKRLVFDDDDIYYTEDHYKTFEHLYDKDGKL